jgi:murein L,D-transpeptidase YcbB/YkuD
MGAYQPVNRQYQLLKKHLLRYYELEKQHDWKAIVPKEKVLRPGDSSASIQQIRLRLQRLGDLLSVDSNTRYDDSLAVGVVRFQKRHGLAEDSAMGPAFFQQLNISPSVRIRQLLVNMERLRWVPAETPPDYLLVNIPAFQLFVFKNDSLDWSMNVVVGSTAHNTVIFRGDMKYIVFSPYWNVPRSIVRNEIEPALRKDSGYLRKNNMERYAGGIRQKPGPGNALGLVKFLFPNQYNIYLHDTPAKSLFARDRRAFSHGCIRLEQARQLAEYLLADNPKWTKEEMEKAMKAGKETWVTLEKTIPVFIGYFTAWESSEGLLHFRDDIYGHDRKLAARLFQ